ncbi:hypothetical protein BDY19DRAFT_1067789 [Irpex rosettiformis]|uniref:Uncharacterized protein n=1 Tax=Irpex rosettiformis TaxID=378272 RepID=A0ACB8UAC3_9APHY|nr:hypothetical protein BDY19DRAFT_1067789 [Irpex rosettiformis]
MQAVGIAARRAASARSTALKLSATVARNYATPVPFIKKEKDPQLGDYPDLPYELKQRRSPFGWDDPQMRRNFGELPHEREELVSMWGPDAPHVAPERAARDFFIAASLFITLGVIAKLSVPEPTAVPREYPYDGLITELGGLEENKARPETILDDE